MPGLTSFPLTAALSLMGLSLAACDDGGTAATRSRMVGTWTAETPAQGGRLERVMTLGADGRVKDSSRVVASGGASALEEREGEWFFDGTNFKRKYTSVNGKPLTNAYFVYETYELKSVSESELVGSSSIGQGVIRLRRAFAGGKR